MEQIELKKILSSAYSVQAWKPILTMLFGNKIEYLAKPKNIAEGRIKNGGHIGNIRLDDGKNIAIFDIEVADSINIRKNRKGLRDIAADYIDQALTHAALVFYHSENQPDYRLTYIAKQTYFTPEGEFVAKETAPKRYTFLLGKNESCTTAAIRMLELAEKRKRGTVYLVDVTDTFSVEKLNNDFFNRYKKFYREFCLYIIDNDNCRTSIFDIEPKEELNHKLNKPIRDFVKKMMGRIVFLHFLQKKGWMGCAPDTLEWKDGDKEFMLNLFNGYQAKDHFYSKCLTELFFNTLNNNARGEEQVFQLTGTRVPYLNGGLFDEDLPKARSLDFSATLFGDFLNFFGEYNFTIDENSPEEQEVGIDPEMLGHIFENLLEDNKDKGTFYTPKEIVYYMCKESLLHYLCSHTEDSLHPHLATLVRDHKLSDELQGKKNRASKIDNLLMGVKICDPAIGSGAFPMGMLHEIFSIRRKLYPELHKQGSFDPAHIKKDIIQYSIYGVDIEKGAVDIARLRFWLALIVDEEKPIPLPNLDFKIMQGNSLLERYKNTDLSKIIEEENDSIYAEQGILNFGDDNHLVREVTIFDTVSRKELQKLIDMYFDFEKGKSTSYNSKYDVKEKIYSIVEGKLLAAVMQEKFKIESEFSKQHSYIEGNKIIGTDTNAGKKLKENNLKKINTQIAKAEAKYAKVKESIEHLKKLSQDVNAEKPYFLWHTFFKDIFDAGGFDIVIGNPPYLRIQGIRDTDPLFADELTKSYKSATGSFDLYAIFVEQGLRIINRDGLVNYIMPVKWTNSAFGKGLRGVVAENRSAYKIINFGAYQVFNASTYTGLQWFKPGSSEMLYYELDRNLETNQELGQYLSSLKPDNAARINADKLNKDAWVLTVGQTTEILNKLEQHPRRISDIFDKIFQGLATSKDDVYFLYGCVEYATTIKGYSKHLNRIIEIEKGLVKPLLKGEDVHRYDTISTDRFVIFPYKLEAEKANLYTEKEISTLYPQGYAYLKECEDVLRDREKGRLKNDDFWFRYIYPKNLMMFDHEKLVAPEISLGGNFAYDVKGKFFATTKIYGYIKKDTIKESYKFWLGLFNSRLFWFYLQNTGYVLRGGYFTFKTNYINPFPVPAEISPDIDTTISNLVDMLIYLYDANNQDLFDHTANKRVRVHIEDVLNMVIYELYFGDHMREVGIDVIADLKGYQFKNDNLSKEIERFYSWYQKSENMIRQKMMILDTRSRNLIYKINLSKIYEQD